MNGERRMFLMRLYVDDLRLFFELLQLLDRDLVEERRLFGDFFRFWLFLIRSSRFIRERLRVEDTLLLRYDLTPVNLMEVERGFVIFDR